MKKKPSYTPTSFRLTPDDMRLIDALSQRTKITNRTDLIRHALQLWLDSITEKKESQSE